MIIVYGMSSCVDCKFVCNQIKDNPGFKYIDIGTDVKLLKDFLRLRDTETVFDIVKKEGKIGIPCFALEDGTITLIPEEVQLASRPIDNTSCSIGGKC